MLEMADAATPRAFLRVGALTVARQQLALALELRCERVICIARGMQPEVIELQHEAEAVGAQFHVVPGARALLGLVTAGDELIVLTDGLFVSTADAADLLGKGEGVLVQPIEQGLAGGFERIDINNAAAGAMRIPGRLVEAIADLPADCDAASALQRIALQAGIRQRAIPSADNGTLFWTLVRDEQDAHVLEPLWIRHRTRDNQPPNPSRLAALLVVRRFGPGMLHAGSGAAHLAVGSAMLALIAAGLGWFGLFTAGLIVCALGWVLREIAGLLARVEARPASLRHRMLEQVAAYGWIIDATIVGLAAFGSQGHAWQPVPDRLFPPLMLVALLRILPRVVEGRWTAWLGDRALLALVLAGAVAGGVGSFATHAGAVVAALAGIALPGLTKRLTRP